MDRGASGSTDFEGKIFAKKTDSEFINNRVITKIMNPRNKEPVSPMNPFFTLLRFIKRYPKTKEDIKMHIPKKA